MTLADRLLDSVVWEPTGADGANADGLPYATHSGVLTLGELELRVYQLSDGRRIIDADDFVKLLGIGGAP